MRQEFDLIIRGRHHDPYQVLGPKIENGDCRIIACAPTCEQVIVIPEVDCAEKTMDSLDSRGIFEAVFSDQSKPFSYRLKYEGKTSTWTRWDPYQFSPTLSDYDLHLLRSGRHYRMYEVLGAHPEAVEGVDGMRFSVWAPSAEGVAVIGDFNGWDGRWNPMRVRGESGVWETFIPELKEGEQYKYEIRAQNGEVLEKADPLALYSEQRPGTASITWGLPDFSWTDDEWIKQRDAADPAEQPLSVYEVHLQSWKRDRRGEMLNYRELADELVEYLDKMNYTHVELMPVQEHPLDDSWGYQIIGYFAPTSRLGEPEDFMYFVNTLHEHGFGVILDWVPGHFPMDDHGLYQFDGTHLYEHADPRKGYHPDWHTAIFNYGRTEVRNFLVASALFWLDQYHIDGLRVDAVASMLYLDYSRDEGQWISNEYGGRENLEAIHFLRDFNEEVEARYPGVLTIAEESTAWDGVSAPTYEGGLGFDLKWNMGWMNDTLEYLKKDPVHRKHHQDMLSFMFYYAFEENFMLVLSHDEVVHGKCSLLEKMPGDDWEKFANLRLLFGFQFAHPGKQLMFMGGEFGQRSEWRFQQSLDWHLLEHELHQSLQSLVSRLNELYRDASCLANTDFDHEGFQWIDHSDHDNSVISFLRGDPRGDHLIFIFHFTPVVRTNYRVGVPLEKNYQEVLNTDSKKFGGSGVQNNDPLSVKNESCHGRSGSIELTLPPLGMIVLSPG